MVKNVTQIKIRTTINVDVSAKIWENVVCMEKIGIIVHVPVKMVNI